MHIFSTLSKRPQKDQNEEPRPHHWPLGKFPINSFLFFSRIFCQIVLWQSIVYYKTPPSQFLTLNRKQPKNLPKRLFQNFHNFFSSNHADQSKQSWESKTKAKKHVKKNSSNESRMYLMYYLSPEGNRVYTLAKVDPSGKPTFSAHPARFSPEDQYSRQRITVKKRFGLLPTQQPALKY